MPTKDTTDRQESQMLNCLAWKWKLPQLVPYLRKLCQRKQLNLLIIALFFTFLLLFPWFLASLWGRAFFSDFAVFLWATETTKIIWKPDSASPIQNKKADFWCLIWSTACSALHVSQLNCKAATVPNFQKLEALTVQSPAGSVGSSPSFAHLSGWAAQPENSW